MGFIGPIEMTLTNQFVEDQRPFFFFFGDRIKIRRKLCHFALKTFFFFFFWRSHENPEKIMPFSAAGLVCTKPEMWNI